MVLADLPLRLPLWLRLFLVPPSSSLLRLHSALLVGVDESARVLLRAHPPHVAARLGDERLGDAGAPFGVEGVRVLVGSIR